MKRKPDLSRGAPGACDQTHRVWIEEPLRASRKEDGGRNPLWDSGHRRWLLGLVDDERDRARGEARRVNDVDTIEGIDLEGVVGGLHTGESHRCGEAGHADTGRIPGD